MSAQRWPRTGRRDSGTGRRLTPLAKPPFQTQLTVVLTDIKISLTIKQTATRKMTQVRPVRSLNPQDENNLVSTHHPSFCRSTYPSSTLLQYLHPHLQVRTPRLPRRCYGSLHAFNSSIETWGFIIVCEYMSRKISFPGWGPKMENSRGLCVT
jgi:hypothetical protein